MPTATVERAAGTGRRVGLVEQRGAWDGPIAVVAMGTGAAYERVRRAAAAEGLLDEYGFPAADWVGAYSLLPADQP
jgi:hypothetical protein